MSEYKLRENPRITLTRRLNQKQPFRIVVAGASVVYVDGGFYAVDLDLRRPGGAGSVVSNLVTGVAGLKNVTSEKGKLATRAGTWPRRSLFRFIDDALIGRTRSKPLGEPFKALVCDDLGIEVADFIGIDEETSSERSRLIFVHAKSSKGDAGVSASEIYDVCSQAAKNLAYLKPDAAELPGSPKKWDGDWKLSGGRVKRLRSGSDGREIRRMIARVRADPNAQRSVWMVLGGGMLSKLALSKELARKPPKPHVLQFAHLILSTYASCQSVGADLRDTLRRIVRKAHCIFLPALHPS